jgi:hypothetical protein
MLLAPETKMAAITRWISVDFIVILTVGMKAITGPASARLLPGLDMAVLSR